MSLTQTYLPMPPATSIDALVMYDARSLARKATNPDTSSTAPKRREGHLSLCQIMEELLLGQLGGAVLSDVRPLRRYHEADVDAVHEDYFRTGLLGQGLCEVGSFASLSDEDWRRDLDLKLFSQIRCTREALPRLRKSRAARIINVNTV